jgi:hypothetical protein
MLNNVRKQNNCIIYHRHELLDLIYKIDDVFAGTTGWREMEEVSRSIWKKEKDSIFHVVWVPLVENTLK